MKKIIIMFLLIFTQLVSALTLQECINKAIKTHPDIKNALLGVDASQSRIKIAKADYLPQVNLNAEYDPTRTYVLPVNGQFNTKDDDGWSVGGVAHQKIWDFSKTISNIEAKKVSKDVASLTLEDAKALLAYKVKLQYELMLVQAEAIKVREKDLQVKEELFKQAQALVKNGMRTKADSTRFLSAVYLAKDNLAITRADYEKAKVSLSFYIGESISENVILENRLENLDTLKVDEETLLDNSLTLKILQKGIKQEGLNYKVAKASHYGSLDAIASYTHQSTLNTYDSSLVGVTLEIPLYSGGRTSTEVQLAMINQKIVHTTYDSKKLALREEFENLLIDIKRYSKTIEAREAQIEASQQTQALLEARYKEGISTYIEVLDANAITLEAKLSLLQAIYEKSSAIHRIEYLQGKII
ncbi:MAG: TolC family protein [Sulfurimonas sp.]